MTGDKGALRAAIQSIEPGDDASSYSELSRVLRSTAETLKTGITAEVFTDDQKTSWPASFAERASTPAPNSSSTPTPISSSRTSPWSPSMRRAACSTRRRSAPSPPSPASTRRIPPAPSRSSPTARLSNRRQVKVPANGRATAEFLTLDAPYGVTKCEIRIDSADAFPQ